MIDLHTTLAVVVLGLLVSIAMVLVRAYRGPTTFDRILAVNMSGSCVVLTIAAVAFLNGAPSYLDMALLYSLINFVATIAILRFFKYGGFGNDQ